MRSISPIMTEISYSDSIHRLIHYFKGLLNLKLHISKAFEDTKIVQQGLLDCCTTTTTSHSMRMNSKSHQTCLSLCESFHFFQLSIKHCSMWLEDVEFSEMMLQILVLIITKSSQPDEIFQYMRYHDGISFCTTCIKMHISSKMIVTASLSLLCKIIDFYGKLISLRSQRLLSSSSSSSSSSSLLLSPKKNRNKSIKSKESNQVKLVLDSSAGNNEIYSISLIQELILQLLSNGIGYCLPRPFEFAVADKDFNNIAFCYKIFDLIIENSLAEYIETICSYNNWTTLKCLCDIMTNANSEDKKKQTMILIFKLLASSSKLATAFYNRGLWSIVHEGIQLYGPFLDIDIKWQLGSLHMIKKLNCEEFLSTILSLIGIVSDRLRDKETSDSINADANVDANVDANANISTTDSTDMTSPMKVFKMIMGSYVDDAIIRIEPHHVELWPTLNKYNSYGYCIKKIPPLEDRVKMAEERAKLRMPKVSRLLKATLSSQQRLDRSNHLPSTKTKSNNQNGKNHKYYKSTSSNLLNESNSFVLPYKDEKEEKEDKDEDETDFITSFSQLVLPSMSLSTTSYVHNPSKEQNMTKSTMGISITKFSNLMEGNENRPFTSLGISQPSRTFHQSIKEGEEKEKEEKKKESLLIQSTSKPRIQRIKTATSLLRPIKI